MFTYYLQAVNKKIEIAKKLNDGEIGGSYYEALLILSSILSTTANILWPGERIDKKKFIELLIHFNHTENDFSIISIPFLNDAKFLTKEQEHILLKKYYTTSFSRILTGEDIDLPENIICAHFSDINLIKLRQYSYANLFYKFIRSSIVHEYSVSKYASPVPMTNQKVFVSYNNNMNHPYRRICFQFPMLAKIVKGIATEIALMEELPISRPAKWWIEGAIFNSK